MDELKESEENESKVDNSEPDKKTGETLLISKFIIFNLVFTILITSAALYNNFKLKNKRTITNFLEPNSNQFFQYTLIILLFWELLFLGCFLLAK